VVAPGVFDVPAAFIVFVASGSSSLAAACSSSVVPILYRA